MSRADQLVERAADRLDDLARRAAAGDGFKRKLAQPLAEDAGLVRGMRPSLIAARLRGEAPPAGDQGTAVREPVAPAPSNGRREQKPKRGPSPIALAVAAFAVGLLAAKIIDWRGHAHPRL